MAKRDTERRRITRFPQMEAVKVKAGGAEYSGTMRDISAAGVFFYCQADLAEQSAIEMVLVLPSEISGGEKQWVCAHGSVVRVEHDSSGQRGVAAKFERLEFLPELKG